MAALWQRSLDGRGSSGLGWATSVSAIRARVRVAAVWSATASSACWSSTSWTAHASPPTEIVLDLDATDDPVHGEQEGRFFHGFYGHYCYLPLYVFCGEFLLGATTWRPASALSRCEDGGIDYILGLAQNPHLRAEIRDEMAAARAEHERTGEDARVFKDCRYKTRDSWSLERRVVGKAEYIPDKENPRFVVTSFSPSAWSARALYEDRANPAGPALTSLYRMW